MVSKMRATVLFKTFVMFGSSYASEQRLQSSKRLAVVTDYWPPHDSLSGRNEA